LHDLFRETHLKVLQPRMISGHLQGRLLSLFSKLLNPQVILEIGTYTGYSAICLAEGLRPDGRLITIDINDELEPIVNKYFTIAGLKDKVDFKVGDAREIIPGLSGNFDLVFIDADKENYSLYFDLVIDRVNPGGLIIADNVLWSGKVLEEANTQDEETRALRDYSEKVNADVRVESMLLPVRDGLMICRKK
jgi:caffeoyl-CoA O-methyltransferase